jgi:hypothetical protein
MRSKFFIRLVCIFALLLFNISGSFASCRLSYDDLQIKKLFLEQQVLMNTAQIDKLKTLYSDNYVSNDGFDKSALFNLYQDTVKNHPDIKYDVYVTKITVDGDYATVRTVSKTKASTCEKSQITHDNGLLSIDMETMFYLKKIGQDWKITSEQTLAERTTLLYGDCKNADIKLCAPEMVEENSEYSAILKVSPKYAKNAMGSIKKELITYPAQNVEDIFKGFDNTGELERVFKSNDSHYNETIAASVAFASQQSGRPNSLDFKISGLGILLQRVNILPLPEKQGAEKK